MTIRPGPRISSRFANLSSAARSLFESSLDEAIPSNHDSHLPVANLALDVERYSQDGDFSSWVNFAGHSDDIRREVFSTPKFSPNGPLPLCGQSGFVAGPLIAAKDL